MTADQKSQRHANGESNGINFSTIFFSHFAQFPKGVRWNVRHDANFRHDFAFLSSLLHDAEIDLKSVRQRGKTVTIQLLRDRWEQYDSKASRPILTTIEARLIISPVESLVFETAAFPLEPIETKSSTSTIDSIDAVGIAQENDFWEFVIACSLWKVRIRLPSFNFRVELIDKKTRLGIV